MVICNSTLSETRDDAEPIAGDLTLHQLGSIICAACALVSCIISFYLMWKHMTNYTNPKEQRQILRILLMIPVYSVTTMFSYVWYWHAVYWEVARDCYEAFAISAFFALLCQYIGPDLASQKEVFSTMAVKPWPWPVDWINKCCKGKLRTPRSGLTWFNICWICIFQYCFVRVATTVIATVTQVTGDYCEESLHPAFAHFWMMFFNILSVTVAMYFLIAFYIQTKVEVAANKPLLKFLCIKLVIFFSFWQMILLDFLSSANIIKPSAKTSHGDVAIGYNAMLICFELMFFSAMHLWAFPYAVYQTSAPPERGPFKALVDTFNLFDFLAAFFRGMKWSIVGHRQRHLEAEKVAARRANSLRQTSSKFENEEGQGLVANAAMTGTFPPTTTTEGFLVHHPTPSNQQSVPSMGFVETSYEGYRPTPVEMELQSPPARLNAVSLNPTNNAALPYPIHNSMPSVHRGVYAPLRSPGENARGPGLPR